MDYLLEYMPAVGDIIRIGKYSYKLGEIISGFFASKNETDSDFAVVWRRTNVFMKDENVCIAGDITALLLLFIGGGIMCGIFSWFFVSLDGGKTPNLAHNYFVLWFVIGSLIFISYSLFGILLPAIRRKGIEESSEIEVTNSEYKLLRYKDSKIGLAFWKNAKDCKVLLSPVYDNIEKGFDNSFVAKKGNKYMLYNADLRMFVAEEYDNIIKYKEGLYLFVKGEDVSLMSAKGDRLYE